MNEKPKSDEAGGATSSALRSALVIVITVAAVALAVWVGRGSVEREVTTEVRSSETIVAAVRNMARLETATMKLQKVVDLRDKQSRFWGSVEVTDALLLIATANVRAGVDLSGLRQGDIAVDEQAKSVTISLPRAQIFSVALDSKETYVYSRATDALATHNAELETKARALAEEMLGSAAEKSDIRALSQRNAEHVLRTLIVSMGFREVTFLAAPGTTPPG